MSPQGKSGGRSTGRETHPVRVLIREVPHMSWEKNPIGEDVIVEKVGRGPGAEQLHPAVRLGADADVESTEFRDAQDEYQRGQIIYLLDADYNRLINTEAVCDVGSEPAVPGSPEDTTTYVDPTTATVEDLRLWIETEKPSENDVIQASGGDPEVASKLLEAESQAQNGEPRKGVFDGLSVVIGRG